MPSPNLNITHVTGAQDNKVTTLNETTDLLDEAMNDTVTIDINNADATLTAAQTQENARILLSSTTTPITADRTVNIQAEKRVLFFEQPIDVDEQFSIIVQVTGGGGTSVVLPNNGWALVYCDGANCDIVARQDSDARTAFAGTTGTQNIDFDGDSIRTVTLSGTTTLALFSPRQGRTILLEVVGGGNSFALPGTATVIGSGAYVAGSTNYLSILCNNAAAPTYLVTISQ